MRKHSIKILCTFFLSFILNSSYSQDKWTKIFNFSSLTDDFAYSVCTDSSGNIYSTGSSETGAAKIFTLKLNSSGQLQWNNIYSAPGVWWGNSAICRNNNSILVSGMGTDSAYILDYNNQGTIMRKNFFPIEDNSLVQVYNMVKTSNNKYLLCGRVEYLLGYAALVDENFSLVWQKKIEGMLPDSKAFYSGTFFENHYYLAGFTDTKNTMLPYITKLDTLGNVIWDKPVAVYTAPYNYGDACRIKVLNGKLLVAGLTYDSTASNRWITYFTQLDKEGNKIKINLITQNSERFYDFQIHRNKIVYVSSILNSSGYPVKGHINILDTNFNLINSGTLNVRDMSSLHSVHLTDNYFYFSGYAWNTGSNDNRGALIIKTDSTLDIPPIGIVNETSFIPGNFKLEKIYPNPFNPSTKISYSIKKSSFIEIKLFDASGKFIKMIQSSFKPEGSYETNLTAESLSSGVYFFALFTDGILADTKKAVLVK